ncbi:MAG: helix-turn-helix domain-containing protein [Saprospiraceae bacterium]
MKLLLDFILIMGIVIILIILFLLNKQRRKELPHRILTLFFVLLFFVTTQFYGELHDIAIIYVLSFVPSEPASYLIGPLIYIYIKSIYLPNKNLVKDHWFHFIPYLFFTVIIFIPVFISLIIDDYLFDYLKILSDVGAPLYETLLEGIYLFTYSFLSLRLLRKYQSTLKDNYSNLLYKDLKWIAHLLIGTMMVMGIDISTSAYEVIFGEVGWQTGYLTIVPAIGLITYLGYYGTSQSRILLPDFLIEKSNFVEVEPEEVVKVISKTENQIREMDLLKTSFLKIIESEKPYLDEDLTLNNLAQLISTTDKKLSTLLNQHMNISFYDFINNCRVAEVKSKIVNSDFENYTLLGIAFDSGFKSKTSFNRIFKKTTGLSPSQYKKQFLLKNTPQMSTNPSIDPF